MTVRQKEAIEKAKNEFRIYREREMRQLESDEVRIGKRAMGALESIPAINVEGTSDSTEIYIRELMSLSEKIFKERSTFQELIRQKDRSILDILKVGTSAGGAKPKAIIAYNETTHEVRSGQVPAPEGFGYWLVKFDGGTFCEHNEITDNPQGIGNIEYAYFCMAKACGIKMSECRLLEENGNYHFMTKRFDRTPKGEKIHVQTAAGIAHLDRDMRHSYEELFGILRKLNLHYKDFVQLYRRMVFNVIARNHDDYTKNFSLLMDKDGNWCQIAKDAGVKDNHIQQIQKTLLLHIL